MFALQLKIPPPVVAALLAVSMWFMPQLAGTLPMGPRIRLVAAICLAIVGLAITLSGMLAFRRVRTTINPLKPAAASSLVVNGVYRFTRNPMYVGLLLALAGWATFLGHVMPYLALPLFIWYITKFQIKPEERVLTTLFGTRFTDYMSRVRRWV